MSVIQVYLDDLKEQLAKLNVDQTVYDEFESNFLEEYKDYIKNLNQSYEDQTIQKEFLDTKEPIEVIIKSLSNEENNIHLGKSTREVKELIYSKFLSLDYLLEPMLVLSLTLGIIIVTAFLTNEYKFFVLEFFSIPILYLVYRLIADFLNFRKIIGQNKLFLSGISLLKISYLTFWIILFIPLEDFIVTYPVLRTLYPWPQTEFSDYLINFIVILTIGLSIYLVVNFRTKEKTFISNQKSDFSNLIMKINKKYWLNVLKLVTLYTVIMMALLFIFNYIGTITGAVANFSRQDFHYNSAIVSMLAGQITVFDIFTLLIQFFWFLGFFMPILYILFRLYKNNFENSLPIVLQESYRIGFYLVIYFISVLLQFVVIMSNLKYY